MASSKSLKPYKRDKPGATEIARVDTDYKTRPEHRGHTVLIDGWNDKCVMLVIISDNRINEALISPDELRALADAAEKDIDRW
jgi:hypothetical protein